MELDVLPTDIPVKWVLVVVLLLLCYLYVWRPFQLLRKMGVPGPTPLPIIGALRQRMHEDSWNPGAQLDVIAKYGTVSGSFIGGILNLRISDPEMLRDVFVKQFHKFTNRAPDSLRLNMKPQSRILLRLKNEDWKNTRSTISPAFSGGKLKLMVESLNSCADLLVESMGKFGDKNESFDTKELTGAFTTDAIARTAFGLDVDSQRNPEEPFVVYSKKAIDTFNSISPLKFIFTMFPSVMKPILENLDYNFIPRDVRDFFYNVVDQLMGMRKDEGKRRGRVDFMQFMVNAHKEDDDDSKEDNEETSVRGIKKPLTKDDIVANGLLFFLAGYETTATTMAFTLYNLALNQEAQDRARQEICQVMEDRELVDYEAVHMMPYLDMCINETLRLYSPAPITFRIAGEEVKLKWLTIPKDTMVIIPILAIHYDPKRWPEPNKFIPERFTKEEREKRDPYDWLPFGAGPRNCIGMRLAMMELKIGLAKMLMKYRIVTGPDTEIPLKIMKSQFFPTPENGIRLMAEVLSPGSN